MRPAILKAFVGLAAVAATRPAGAHLVETGFGAFYDGVAHFSVSLTDLLVVIALALFAAQQGIRAARYMVIVLPVAWLIGGLIGMYWPSQGALSLLTTLSFALCGMLVALNINAQDISVAVFASAVGALHGFVNGATMTVEGARGLALTGVVSALFLLTTILSAEVVKLPVGWPQIAVRVAGSWIAATGLLMLGWITRMTAL